MIPGSDSRSSARDDREQYSGRGPPSRKLLAVFLAILAFLIPLTARAQTYYYTGNLPMVPSVGDTATPCDANSIGAIRFNTGTAVFEGCNGVAWADIRNGAAAAAAGSDGQIQFNSGGLLGASSGLVFTSAGRLGIGTPNPQAQLQLWGAKDLGIKLLVGGNDEFPDNFLDGLALATVTVIDHNADNALIVLDDNDFTTPRFVVQRQGNVGIGTTAPTEKLEVNGGIAIGGTEDNFFIRRTVDNSNLWLTGGSNDDWGQAIISLNGKSNENPGEIDLSGDTITFSEASSPGNEAMRITSGYVGIGTPTPGTSVDVNGGVTMEPSTVTLTANNTVLATANRSYFRVTSDNTTAANRIFCFGAGTLGQVLVIEWTSSTNKGQIVKGGNCGGAVGAVPASISYTQWAPNAAETILQLMYNGTHWIQIAGSANY